ncbi:hypothetical protein [Kingella negevensis]|nr:hypothetical protein [Kingella negevensis]WII91401.1 hypothetical protein QEO93_02120 [Kingella negevensis]
MKLWFSTGVATITVLVLLSGCQKGDDEMKKEISVSSSAISGTTTFGR